MTEVYADEKQQTTNQLTTNNQPQTNDQQPHTTVDKINPFSAVALPFSRNRRSRTRSKDERAFY
ncbi:MAG TPA: hypothetical protein VJJ82_05200 [Candidatus Nanoarchaeia archaeon]|nr:hypothetical protein [Candidatus Nanoarchaeia archaeon]